MNTKSTISYGLFAIFSFAIGIAVAQSVHADDYQRCNFSIQCVAGATCEDIVTSRLCTQTGWGHMGDCGTWLFSACDVTSGTCVGEDDNNEEYQCMAASCVTS